MKLVFRISEDGSEIEFKICWVLDRAWPGAASLGNLESRAWAYRSKAFLEGNFDKKFIQN
jgi:hypothetical protein